MRASKIIRAIWAACLIVGGLNHARILLQHGLNWDYGGVGRWSALYWSSLTVIDPLVAALLFVRPKQGILATVLLIVTNVVHNSAVSLSWEGGGLAEQILSTPTLSMQVAFLLFVVASAPPAWRGLRRP